MKKLKIFIVRRKKVCICTLSEKGLQAIAASFARFHGIKKLLMPRSREGFTGIFLFRRVYNSYEKHGKSPKEPYFFLF